MTLSMGILDLGVLLQALKVKPYVMTYLAPKSQKGKLEGQLFTGLGTQVI